MAQEIKTNTAISIGVGPFYDKTDGVTPEIALTVANSLITLIAETDDNSAPTLILDNVAGNDGTNTLAHITNDNAGYYSLLLTAANVNRLGRMKLTIEDAANHCPVFHELEVVSAQYYNAKYGSGNFSADAKAINGVATTSVTAVNAIVGTAVAAGSSGGPLISGSNAGTTTLAALTVTGAVTLSDTMTIAKGLAITNSTAGGPGLAVTGNTTGAGILATGGNAAPGISAVGIGTNGHGILATSGTTAGTAGIKAAGGATNATNGMIIAGGTTSGTGLVISATSGTGATIDTLSTSGLITLNALTVTGALTTGSAVVTGTLGVGATTLASLAVTGALSVGTTTTLTGAVGTGSITAAAITATGALTTGSIVNNGVLTQTGTATISALTVTNALTAGTNAIPWNAAWDAEVESEANDALVANNLDHLALTATGIPAITAGTYIDQMMDDGTAVYDRTTDSLQAIRDNMGTMQTGDSFPLVSTEMAEIYAAVITNAAEVDVAADIIALRAVADLIEDILRNRMEITDGDGTVLLKNDAGGALLAGAITDDLTTTIRTRLA